MCAYKRTEDAESLISADLFTCKMTTKKILMTNASSKTAYSFLPMLCSGDVLGADQKLDLVLFDFKPLAEQIALLKQELTECCYRNVNSISATVDINYAFHDVDVAILSELEHDVIGFRNNAVLFRSYGIIINTHASKNVKILVCGKTANTSAFICSSFSPSIPPDHYTCLVQHLQQNIIFNLLQYKYSSSISSSSRNNKNKENNNKDDNKNVQKLNNNDNSGEMLLQFQQQQQQQHPRVYCKLLDEFMKNNDTLFNSDNNNTNNNNNQNNNTNYNNNQSHLASKNALVWGGCQDPIITSTSMQHTFKAVTKVEPGSLVTSKSIAEHLRFWLTDNDDKEYFNMGVVSRNTPYNIDKNIYFNMPVTKRHINNNNKPLTHNNNNNNNGNDNDDEGRGIYSGSDFSLASYSAAASNHNNYNIYNNSSVDETESYNLATTQTTHLATNPGATLLSSNIPSVTFQVLKVKVDGHLQQLLSEASQQLCQQRDNAIIDCWRIVLPHSHL